ncbi:PREDICTED: protein takeout-like [Nicrophorus vespilloides]|uniref:Protein takeout-like n=1 Tax=Nicrophorus vespilloides TaxID=110193 RepID=A0ABM1MF87_NICVS|nr:PREDICTED: protein takeout-like [Nicrophorus vespilloides]
MKLRAIDPVVIDKLNINYGNGTSLNLDAQLTNVKVYGVINAKVTKVLIDTDKKDVELHIFLPDLYFHADYKGTGQVLLIKLDSNGIMTTNLTDVNVVAKLDSEVIENNGKEYLKTEITELTVDIKTLNFNLSNLFKDQALTDNTNKVINENIHDLYNELRPIIVDAIKAIVRNPVKNIMDGYPFDVLFPK